MIKEQEFEHQGLKYVLQYRHDSVMILGKMSDGRRVPLREVPISRSKYSPVSNQIKPKGDKEKYVEEVDGASA